MDTDLKVGGVTVTNLDRVLYPSSGVSKRDVIEYYIRAAPRMLPFFSGRPLVMQRFPEGVGQAGFYEKNAPAGTPGFVTLHRHYSRSAEREIRYVVCDRVETLIWMANLAALELNIVLARTDDPERPDIMLFDLDPEPPAGFTEAVETAQGLGEVLGELGLSSFVKTSGRKGLHVVIPLERVYRFEETRSFVHALGILLSRRLPGVVSELSGTHVAGTVFVDYLQNAAWKTMIGPYSLRATAEATVSMPLAWEELREGLVPEDFTIHTAISRTGDPWKGFFDRAERLPKVNHD
ncbi:MAG TPA: non-homologous end-joining DNA ligase [Methanoregulaceae archaeon]|nr:MAG: non-homologous end-joining DNA ligase [Methanolinea sp.]HON81732.1 non-homologous end-joining DNA ligase [Methanoregulaceae archaeon]HPD10540.1 non-homologous end-joining DNA ligase [Methanoregulaceae archaeon]HRT15611.1 non-homologous end-joining DNA ligase [Methanoregulaceae archaeon]HRU31183.1 non-homologous end-joining DNA ligase [Methanoregulaceae archaeon]